MAVVSVLNLPAMPVLHLAVFVVPVLVVLWLIYPRRESREPPYLKPSIPIIGHVVGLLTYGIAYYERAAKNAPVQIFTLDLLVNRLYIVNSARLVPIIQRNRRIISFDPFLTAAANRLAGVTGKGLRLLQETRSGGGGLLDKLTHSMSPSLLGKGLDKTNRTMLTKLGLLMDDILSNMGECPDLHQWCRHVITVASTEAIWGAQNPFRDEQVVKDFWYFESHLSPLLANIYPTITARKSHLAREAVYRAMLRYTRAGGYEDDACSELAKARRQAQMDGGATDEDIARMETALNVGILSNTAPSAFWTIFEIFSNQKLLEIVREEIRCNALVVDPETKVHAIDLSRIRGNCPAYVAIFQEILRLRSNGGATRMVYEDIMLDGTYLLKAGSVVQLPSPAINRDASAWGSSCREFDHLRFLNKDQHTKPNGKTPAKPSASAFMSFGISPNVCPGRHFAAAEILCVAAMLVMRVDLTPTRGDWWTPRLNYRAIAASMSPPAEAYPVDFQPRKEFEGVKWTFTVSGGKDKFELITG